ncbi:MAG: bifunctional methionine sulfoxide reductase B/A protein [Bacteroidales bacterium]
MITWKDILLYVQNGNPEPPRIVEHTKEEWKKLLSPEVFHITREKGTEPANTDLMCSKFEPGIYTCACCDNVLFDSDTKFNSGTGWPSFTQPVLPNAIRYAVDLSYGMERIEANCNVCGAHLGHVFPDGPAPSRLRYCMNSVALKKQENTEKYIATAVFGGGCFWCTEAIFKGINGVIKVEPGYAGGFSENPTYQEVCNQNTGHAEVIRVTYEPELIDYASLIRIHLETHDPTTLNQQGNDKGPQYRSVIFYKTEKQKEEALQEINHFAGIYEDPIVTEVLPLEKFYPAETYHQDYYAHHKEEPYCQLVIKPKLDKFQKAHQKEIRLTNS